MTNEELLSKALRALVLTRDYVDPTGELLPPIDGWEWYDAGKSIAEAIPQDQWAKQFWLEVEKR